MKPQMNTEQPSRNQKNLTAETQRPQSENGEMEFSANSASLR